MPVTEILAGAQVAFFGLGKMGTPMSRRLAEAGYLVRGYHVSEPRLRSWARTVPGAVAASGPAAAVDGAAAIIFMLPDSPAVTSVLAEILPAAARGASGRSGSTENKWPNYIVPATYNSGFTMQLMIKDMLIALGIAESAGTQSRLAAFAAGLWAEAAAALGGDADHTEIARWLGWR